MKHVKRAFLGAAILCFGLLLVAQVWHRLVFGDFIRYGWHVDVWEQKQVSANPAGHRVYMIRVANYTLHSLTFEAIVFPPGFEADMFFPYSRAYHEQLQRWDAGTRTWTGLDLDRGSALSPLDRPNTRVHVRPLGRIYGRRWVVGALDGFKKGDIARIVLFSSFKPEGAPSQHAFYSAPFVVDVQ